MTTAIHRLRLARGQSLRQLADDVGCSYQTLHRIEHGKTDVRPSTRKALEDAFGLPFEVIAAPMNTNAASPEADGAKNDSTTAKRETS